jgi:hypothetical protein
MNQSLSSRLRAFLEPAVARAAPTGVLSDAEHRTVHALFEALTGDDQYPPALLRRHVERRTAEDGGYLEECRAGLALLRRAMEREWLAGEFVDLTHGERDRVLRRILRSYPHEEKNAWWRRRLRLTSENLDLVAGRLWRRAVRRFRVVVVRDLLEHYYTGPSGWAVVGYREFPGRVRSESEPCKVLGFRIEGDSVVLELSDSTYETLDPRNLELDEGGALVVTTKSSRQRAGFSHAAQHAIGELLQEDEHGGLSLMIGSVRHEVFRDGE